ncbi:MAG: FAD-dependent oxidoreductase [Bacteriovoracaceae bacterium]
MSLKDLTDSFWELDFQLPRFQKLNQNLKTEICVVGGGIAGLSIAYQMAKRGHKVTLVEGFRLLSGQTGRTTAHLSHQLERLFTDLIRWQDKENLKDLVHAHVTAIDTIEHIIETENIDCEFERVNGYLFSNDRKAKEILLHEQKTASECGLNLEFISETPVLKNKKPSLLFKDQAQFHPIRYCWGLMSSLTDLGVEIYEGTYINDITNLSPDISILKTADENVIEAKFVVLATHTPINKKLSVHFKQIPLRTYAMAFETDGIFEDFSLLWDTEKPYHYVRFERNLLIVGGEDHRVGDHPIKDPFLQLETWARQNFDFIGNIKNKWSGQILESLDHIPFIGYAPGENKNIFIISGEAGQGMTYATIASILIPELIEKKEHPWESILNPMRKLKMSNAEFVKDSIATLIHYKDWITPSEVKVEELTPQNAGCLLREGLKKKCVYHDKDDHFEKTSAICSHLGGIVHWNDIEKTWDCPMHGSRYDVHGHVLEGPAISNLADS